MVKKAITLQQLEEALRDLTRWIRDKLKGYLQEPADEGKSGYVLTTNGAGGRSWEAVGGLEIDSTLSVEGAAADAAAAGAAIAAAADKASAAAEAAVAAQDTADSARAAADSPVTTDRMKDGAVTRAKLADNVTAQALGGMVCDVLWVNASPASSFAAQTISVNLTDYAFIAVEVVFNTSSKDIKNMFFFRKNNDRTRTYHAIIPNDPLGYSMNRRFTATNSSLVFNEGIKNTNGSVTTDNSAVVPLYIYGIKGVQ